MGPELDDDPAALGGGLRFGFVVELLTAAAAAFIIIMGSRENALLGVVFCEAGAGASGVGLAHVVVPLRLTEPDFTKKKPPLS